MKKIIPLALICLLLMSCNEQKTSESASAEDAQESAEADASTPKLSLAQWSLHRRYLENGVNPLSFPKDAAGMGFKGIELVSQLYGEKIEEQGFEAVVDSLDKEIKNAGVQCVLIMVDGEGDLADPNDEARNTAVENHKKWIDAAKSLGAHSIRVNAFGSNDPAVWKVTLEDGLTKLAAYGEPRNINVLVENHGWLSSDADLLMEVMDEIDRDNCGTLPDFGNWCVKRPDGARWGDCIEEYPDKYQGLAKMMERAKAVSAKSYDFDEQGNETTLDYGRMLDIVKAAGYEGYIGIEYEGGRLSEEEGIDATRELILKASN